MGEATLWRVACSFQALGVSSPAERTDQIHHGRIAHLARGRAR
jgi:hypothetical protein